MKIRQQVARPCEKKGLDNSDSSNSCECLATCDKLKGFLKKDTLGTVNYNTSSASNFNGCLEIEEFLIKENLIRYESREVGGLEILFEGIESIYNLNAEIFNNDYLEGVELGGPIGVADFYLDSLENKLTDKVDNDKRVTGRFTDESLVNFFPETLGFAQSSSHDLFSTAPQNIQDSFFISLYAQGEFEKDTDDIQDLATCLIHGIDNPKEILKVWPRYTKARYEKLKTIICKRVNKKMPWWAKRFNKIWSKLSDAQAEALSLEWFYEADEKPTQQTSADKLGISLSSYQERLHWAYKKLEELYPELKRRRRRPKTQEISNPSPLYLINSNNQKTEIPFPVKKYKTFTFKQKMLIKKMAKGNNLDDLKSVEELDE